MKNFGTQPHFLWRSGFDSTKFCLAVIILFFNDAIIKSGAG